MSKTAKSPRQGEAYIVKQYFFAKNRKKNRKKPRQGEVLFYYIRLALARTFCSFGHFGRFLAKKPRQGDNF